MEMRVRNDKITHLEESQVSLPFLWAPNGDTFKNSSSLTLKLRSWNTRQMNYDPLLTRRAVK